MVCETAELSRKMFSNVSNTSLGHYQYNFRRSLLSEVIITSSLVQKFKLHSSKFTESVQQ